MNMGDVLPMGVARERVQGVGVVNGKLMMVSPFYGEVRPQVGVKKGVYQVVVCWGAGGQLREFLTF